MIFSDGMEGVLLFIVMYILFPAGPRVRAQLPSPGSPRKPFTTSGRRDLAAGSKWGPSQRRSRQTFLMWSVRFNCSLPPCCSLMTTFSFFVLKWFEDSVPIMFYVTVHSKIWTHTTHTKSCCCAKYKRRKKNCRDTQTCLPRWLTHLASLQWLAELEAHLKKLKSTLFIKSTQYFWLLFLDLRGLGLVLDPSAASNLSNTTAIVYLTKHFCSLLLWLSMFRNYFNNLTFWYYFLMMTLLE